MSKLTAFFVDWVNWDASYADQLHWDLAKCTDCLNGDHSSVATGADYIPEKDVDAEQWLSCFAQRVAQEPKAFRAAQSDVDDALAAAKAGGTALGATATPHDA